jgi:hypothetical protein
MRRLALLPVSDIVRAGRPVRIGPEPARPPVVTPVYSAAPGMITVPAPTPAPTAASTSTTTPGVPVPTPAQQATIFGLDPTVLYIGGGLLAAWLLLGRKH